MYQSLARVSPRAISCLLLLVFLLVALFYSSTNPGFEAPDEVGHYAFVQHLATTGSLPQLRSGETGEAHQPPLYYVFAALASLPADFRDTTGSFRSNPQFMWAGQGGADINAGQHGTAETFPYRGVALALHLARVSSVLMGLGTVLLTLLIGRRVFPNHPQVGLLGAVLVAFIPQYLFISGSINNDNLATLLSAATLLQMVRLLESPDGTRDWVLLGVLVGLGVLTKLSGGVLALLALIQLIVCAVQRRSPRMLGPGLLAIGVPGILVAGWWFVRNQILYGDPVGWTLYKQVFAANLRYDPLTLAELQAFITTQFRSFLGVFGWMNLNIPSWYYRLAGGLGILGLFGIVMALFRYCRIEVTRFQWTCLTGMALAVLAQEAYVVATLTQCNASCYQGRYLFPMIAPLMLLIAFGVLNLVPIRHSPLVVGIVGVSLIASALYMPLRIIRPAYATVPQPKSSVWLLSQKTHATFGDQIRLFGYEVRTETDGRTIRLTLYWQAVRRPDFNYSAFVHLIDGDGQVVAQKDHAPGEDRGYPPLAWSPEDIVTDTHTLALPSGTNLRSYRFRVGLYNWETGQQLAMSSPGQPGDSFIMLEPTAQAE